MPDLNPLEKYFFKLHWLREAARRTPDAVYSAISMTPPKTKPHECSNFFALAGYDKPRVIPLQTFAQHYRRQFNPGAEGLGRKVVGCIAKVG